METRFCAGAGHTLRQVGHQPQIFFASRSALAGHRWLEVAVFLTGDTARKKFPNSPLTVVIFGKSYANFPGTTTDLYRDKNICVQGKIELYKGKPEIIVEKAAEITVYWVVIIKK